jgi:hypothetical protein
VKEEALRVFGNPLQDFEQLGSDRLLAFDGLGNRTLRRVASGYLELLENLRDLHRGRLPEQLWSNF